MSAPINHHYVSRCQSNCFFNSGEGRIYYLDKTGGYVNFKTSTKTLFSEEDSNTILDHLNNPDRLTLEKDLKDNFEDHYSKYLSVVQSSILNAPQAHPEFDNAILFFTKFGIIGDMRNPDHKVHTDQTMDELFYDVILPNADDNLKKQLEEFKMRMSKVKHSNVIPYSYFAEKVYSAMGGTKSMVSVISDNRYFLLPDKSSIQKRERINEHFNPDIQEIAMIGIPISSRLFIHSESIKLNKLRGDLLFLIHPYEGIGEVERINYALYKMAYQRVACESRAYLDWFLENLKAIENKFYN